MIIFFIRHGLTDWNIQRRMQGTCDIPLNDDGVAQARAVAARCAQLGLERIYHSTLTRAAQTAAIIAEAAGAPLIPCQGFNEVCLGVFQGLTLQQRALLALGEAERDAGTCERIAIVSHGALLKALLGGILGIPLTCFAGFDVSNGSVSVIESKAGERRLITLNDMAHFGDYCNL